MDVSGRVRGVVLMVGGGVDLSAIALLRCAFFYFYSRVSGGAIVACLTELEEKKGSLLLFCKVHSLHSFIIDSQVFYKCICHTSEFMSFNLTTRFWKQNFVHIYIYILKNDYKMKEGVLAPIHQKIT